MKYAVKTVMELDFVVEADNEKQAKEIAEEKAFQYETDPYFTAEAIRLATEDESDEDIVWHNIIIDACPACGHERTGLGKGIFVPGSVCSNCGHVEPEGNDAD